MSSNNLPVGFIPVNDAILLIQNHSKQKPRVMLGRIMEGWNSIKKGNNYTIFLATMNKNGTPVENGECFVYLETNLDVELLKDALRKKYAEMNRVEFSEDLANANYYSSVVADSNDGGSYTDGRCRRVKSGLASSGDSINSGQTINIDKMEKNISSVTGF